MRRMSGSLLKSILILAVYLFFVVIWGVSLVMWVVDESETWFIVWLISSAVVLVAAFFVEANSKDYKLKYYFLGKKFQKQKDEYFKTHNPSSKKEKRQLIKDMKLNYRRFGNIEYVVKDYVITPIRLYFDDYVTFNYGNALDEQKTEFIIYSLYAKCLEGGGLYRFFEQMVEEPFSYEEYKTLVKKSTLSHELKTLTTNAMCKKVFECFEKYDDIREKGHKFLENFELNESNQLFDYQDEIFGVVEKIAMNKYFEYQKTRFIPKNAKKSYISKDNLQRLSICYLEDLNVFNIIREKFTFFDTGAPILHSDGGWSEQEGKSYYETEELALNDIKNEINDYIEINF